MNRRIFEYFVDPQDLEPFFSELPLRHKRSVCREQQTTSVMDEKATAAKAAVPQPVPTPPASKPTDSLGSSAGKRDVTDSSIESLPGNDLQNSGPEALPASKEIAADDVNHDGCDKPRTRVRRLLSVHAFGQSLFCMRSAILAVENGDERDVDEPSLRLTYLPNFNREKIEEQLSAKMMQVCFFVLYGVCLCVLMRMGVAQQNRWLFYSSAVAFIGLFLWCCQLLVTLFRLVLRHQAAVRAEAIEPEPDISRIRRVNWWSMLKAGFEPIEYSRPFQHPDFPLEGNPWRVLQRGSRRIPVIRSGAGKLGAKPGELYPKHQIRLVAYAMLLEASGMVDVPYGLVFPIDSPHGFAMPITEEQRRQAVRLLETFEQQLFDSQRQNQHPGLPEQRSRCSHCDYGQPVRTTPQEIEKTRKTGSPFVVLQHHSGDVFHCDCGDRFDSVPPHNGIVQRQLQVVVD